MKLYVTLLCALFTSILFGQTLWQESLAIRQSGDLEWRESSITTEDNGIIHVWSEYRNEVKSVLAMKYNNVGNPLWGDNPIIVAESNDNQYYPQAIATNDGGLVIVWIEQVNSNHIRGQKLDASGNRLWSDQGLFISDQFDEDQNYLISLYPNLEGGAIISWMYGNTTTINLDSNGDNLWVEMNLNIGSIYRKNQIVSDGYGGLIVLDTQEDSYFTNVRRFGESGELLWEENVVMQSPGSYNQVVELIYDNNDNYYIILEDFRENSNGVSISKISSTGEISSDSLFIPLSELNGELYPLNYTCNENGDLFISTYTNFISNNSYKAFRIDSNLNHVWNDVGVSINDFDTSALSQVKISASDTGDLFILNIDSVNSYLNPSYDINLFKIDADGSLENDEGILVFQNQGSSYVPFLSYQEDLFVTWKEMSEGYLNLKHKTFNDNLQALTSSSNENIRLALTGSATVNMSFPLADTNQIAVIWLDYRMGDAYKLKYQIVNPDGSVELAVNGVDIADFTYDENYDFYVIDFVAEQNDQGQICVVWITNNLGTKIQSRIIDTDGSLLASNSGQEVYLLSPNEELINMSISSYDNVFYLSYMLRNYPSSERIIYSTRTNTSLEWEQANIVDSYSGSSHDIFEIYKTINNYCIVKESNQIHHAYKIAEDGAITESEQVLFGYDFDFDCDDANNLFYTWYSNGIMYLQGLTETDQEYWNAPIQVSYEGPDANVQARFPAILVRDSAINVLWSQPNNDSEIDLRGQKIDYSGNKLWPQYGLLISTNEYYFNLTHLQETFDGHIIAGWRKYNGTSGDYRLSIIDDNGTICYAGYSDSYTGSATSREWLSIITLASDELFITWINEGGLHAQLVDFVSVDNDDNDVSMISNDLMQNYPNPFNPETNISFNVRESGNVKIDIYNIKGQKVKTLINDSYLPGIHDIVWKGKDDNNKQVASGIYLYKMRNGKFSSTRKMILMK